MEDRVLQEMKEQYPKVRKINFLNNNLTNLDIIFEKFYNVEIAVLGTYLLIQVKIVLRKSGPIAFKSKTSKKPLLRAQQNTLN